MTTDEYQEKAHSFAIGGGDTLIYAILGLLEEVGELLVRTDIDTRAYDRSKLRSIINITRDIGAEAKYIRSHWDEFDGPRRAYMLETHAGPGAESEIGDILWMLANICHHMGIKMSEVMEKNIAKLEERRETGTICGSGETVEERLKNAKG